MIIEGFRGVFDLSSLGIPGPKAVVGGLSLRENKSGFNVRVPPELVRFQNSRQPNKETREFRVA